MAVHISRNGMKAAIEQEADGGDLSPVHRAPPVLTCNPSKFCPSVLPWSFHDLDTLCSLHTRTAHEPFPSVWSASQPLLTADMRAQVLDWMLDLASDTCMKRETFHGAVWILDSYLCKSRSVPKGKVQLVGLASLMISAKIEEIAVPSINDYAESAEFGFSVREIRRMEQDVLSTLQWKVVPSTLSSWVNWTLCQWDEFAIHTFSPDMTEIPLFKIPQKHAYESYRYCTQLADAAVFKLAHYNYRKAHLAAAVLYLGLANSIANLTDSLEDFTAGKGRDKEGSVALKYFPEFARAVLGVEKTDDVRMAIEFVWDDGRVQRVMEMPKACDVMAEETLESHFEDFMAFQTYAKFIPV